MVVGALIALCCLSYALSEQILQPSDQMVFILFFLSVTLHMPLSVGYHVFMPISAVTDLFVLEKARHWRRFVCIRAAFFHPELLRVSFDCGACSYICIFSFFPLWLA